MGELEKDADEDFLTRESKERESRGRPEKIEILRQRSSPIGRQRCTLLSAEVLRRQRRIVPPKAEVFTLSSADVLTRPEVSRREPAVWRSVRLGYVGECGDLKGT
jgi:hypothetical protein